MGKKRLLAILLSAWAMNLLAEGQATVDVLRASNEGIHRFTLDNGAIGLVKPDASAPVAAIQIWFGTGSIHEEDYLGAGLSHYVEHMIFKGTDTRKPGDITREIDSAGGRINAYTTFDRTVFHVVLPADNWETGLEILSDAVKNATFPEDEWESEKKVILQEMAMNRDNPQRELSRLLWATAFREHPYQHPVIGYEEVFLQTTRDDLLHFFRRHYTPDNMLIAVVGNLDPSKVETRVRDAFSDFERRMRRPVVIPAEPPQIAPRFARQTGPYEVSRAVWGWHTVPIHHEDAATLDILAAIAGRGESSRLTLDIRDQQQLVHEISAWSFTAREPGLFGISATFDPDQETAVIHAVEKKIEGWRDTSFTRQEIDKARRQVMVRTLQELQSMRGQANSIASGEFYAGDPRFSERYLTQLEAVTPEKLHDAVNRYIQPHNRTRALLTPETAAPEQEEEREREPLISPPERLTLDNGIPLIVRQDQRLPLSYVSIAFLGGILSETESDQGITRFMAELLPRGTSSRSAREIAEQLEAMGASLSPFSGQNSFGIQATSLTEDLDDLLAIIADCLLDAAFPETEITRQRARQMAEIRRQREQPMSVADQTIREILYPDHPYQWTPLGDETAVSKIDRTALKNHLAQHLATGNMAISIFGNLEPAQALKQVNRAFDRVPTGEKVEHRPPKVPPALPATTEQREPHQQTIYLQAFPGVRLDDPRNDALDVLQSALSGLSSTLGVEVRDKRGLVYFVGAMQRAGLAPGRFALYAGTYEEAVPELKRLFEEEIERVTTEGLTEEEFSRAQEQLIGDFYSTLQNNAALAQISALNELYELGYDHAFTREQRIRSLSRDDVRRAAADILDPDRSALSIIYPVRSSE